MPYDTDAEPRTPDGRAHARYAARLAAAYADLEATPEAERFRLDRMTPAMKRVDDAFESGGVLRSRSTARCWLRRTRSASDEPPVQTREATAW